MQGSNEDADIENRVVDTVEEGEGGLNGESIMERYTLSYGKYIASGNLLYEYKELNPGLSEDLEGWKGVADGQTGDRPTPTPTPGVFKPLRRDARHLERGQERGDIHIPIVDSCLYTAETNPIL